MIASGRHASDFDSSRTRIGRFNIESEPRSKASRRSSLRIPKVGFEPDRRSYVDREVEQFGRRSSNSVMRDRESGSVRDPIR